MNVDGKFALVTGASSGIGEATARACEAAMAEAGAPDILVNDAGAGR